MIGIFIWISKVILTIRFSQPSFRTSAESFNPKSFTALGIYLVFFSPNILLWPINVILDIYIVYKESGLTPVEILHALVGV